jgi:hypothetical protein
LPKIETLSRRSLHREQQYQKWRKCGKDAAKPEEIGRFRNIIPERLKLDRQFLAKLPLIAKIFCGFLPQKQILDCLDGG